MQITFKHFKSTQCNGKWFTLIPLLDYCYFKKEHREFKDKPFFFMGLHFLILSIFISY